MRSSKTQKSGYFGNEALLFLKKKKNSLVKNIIYQNTFKVYNMAKNSLLVGVNFKDKISSVLNSHLAFKFVRHFRHLKTKYFRICSNVILKMLPASS